MVVETSVGFDTPVEAFPQPRGKKVDVSFLEMHFILRSSHHRLDHSE